MNAIVSTKTVIAQKKRRIFLKVLAETGRVIDAAKACGYTSPDYLQKYRRENDDFAEEWDQSLETA